MSNRRGAPSQDKECVLRRKWYAEAQKKEFRGSDSSSSDEEESVFEDETVVAESKTSGEEKSGEKEKEVKEIKKKINPPPTTFTNFASTLGSESSNRIVKTRNTEKIAKGSMLDLDRALPEFAAAELDLCMHKISDPPERRAILICCGGFGDNGRMFQEYGAYFEDRGVQVLSFTFPGKLHRVNEELLSSILEYVDWVVASLLHHNIMMRLDKGKQRQGVLPDMPPITIFGHDFGSTVGFEMIRLLKKSKTVYMPIHHFIVSACRPPEVLSEFNSNDLSRKFSDENADALMKRFLEIGFARPYMSKPGEERSEILHLYLPCFRSEYRALETYNFKRSIGRQGPALDCNITALGGSDDVFAGGEQVLNKWRDSTSGGCSVHVFEKAGHFYWKYSDDYEDHFLEYIIEKLFVTEETALDESFVEAVSLHETPDEE